MQEVNGREGREVWTEAKHTKVLIEVVQESGADVGEVRTGRKLVSDVRPQVTITEHTGAVKDQGFTKVGFWQNVIVRVGVGSRSGLAIKRMKMAELQPHQCADRRQPSVEHALAQVRRRHRDRRHAKPSSFDPQGARLGQSWGCHQEDHRGLHARAAGRCVFVKKSMQVGKCYVTEEVLEELAGRVEASRTGGQRSSWLECGAPAGVACDVNPVGIFPCAGPKGASYEDIQRCRSLAEPLANSGSVEARGVGQGGGRRHRVQVVVRCHRALLNVDSKIAATAKLRDGTRKLRLWT